MYTKDVLHKRWLTKRAQCTYKVMHTKSLPVNPNLQGNNLPKKLIKTYRYSDLV